MDRSAWLAERRAATIADYDEGAAGYEADAYPVEAQERFVARLLETCPPGGLVLDAPCGTGRYFPLVAAAGRRVVGIDQSAGMLAEARAKGVAVSLEHVGLQDLAFDADFDGVMTIDAMENVSPEDWPLVLANLHRAVRPGGHIYLTVEEVDGSVIDAAYRVPVGAAACPRCAGRSWRATWPAITTIPAATASSPGSRPRGWRSSPRRTGARPGTSAIAISSSGRAPRADPRGARRCAAPGHRRADQPSSLSPSTLSCGSLGGLCWTRTQGRRPAWTARPEEES